MERLRICRGDQLFRCDTLLDPALQREDRVMLRIERHRDDAGLPEIHCPGTAATVIHAGHHEQPVEVPYALQPAIGSDDPAVLVCRAAWEGELTSPAMIGNGLSAMSTQSALV